MHAVGNGIDRFGIPRRVSGERLIKGRESWSLSSAAVKQTRACIARFQDRRRGNSRRSALQELPAGGYQPFLRESAFTWPRPFTFKSA